MVKTILEKLPIGIFILSNEKTLLEYNKKSLTLLNIQEEDLLLNDLIYLFPVKDFSEYLDDILKGSIKTQDVELIINSKNININFTMCDLDSKSGIIITIEDISRFRNVDIIKSDFINKILHKIRTPLTSIKTSLSILSSDMIQMNDSAKEIANISHQEVNRLVKLMTDMKNVFSIDTDLFVKDLFIENIKLSTVFEKVLVKLDKEKENYSKRVVISKELDLYVISDFDKLQQVFLYVIHNALVYSDIDTKITIDIIVKDSFVTIKVKDTGLVISAEDVNLIFDKFYRGTQASSKYNSGSGLGLYISRSFLNAMNGNIYCEVVDSKDCVFCIDLPINLK